MNWYMNWCWFWMEMNSSACICAIFDTFGLYSWPKWSSWTIFSSNKFNFTNLNFLRDCQLQSGLPSLKRCACGNSIFLTIGENFLLITGLLPIILISSSSSSDFCHADKYFWKSMTHYWIRIFCCCCSLTSLNLIALIFDNERKT